MCLRIPCLVSIIRDPRSGPRLVHRLQHVIHPAGFTLIWLHRRPRQFIRWEACPNLRAFAHTAPLSELPPPRMWAWLSLMPQSQGLCMCCSCSLNCLTPRCGRGSLSPALGLSQGSRASAPAPGALPSLPNHVRYHSSRPPPFLLASAL